MSTALPTGKRAGHLSIPWAWSVGLGFMALTLLPYLFGWSIAFDRYYTAFHYNPDDFCVYTAWMTQAANGHFFLDNRFTTDPQPAKTIHVLFWLLGTIERATHLPPQVLLHLARFLFGVLFVWAFYRLARKLLKEEQTARFAVIIALLGSGLGWLMWPAGGMGWDAPADTWQPELMTFTSLYFNPLFAAAGWLILEIWNAALDARRGWGSVPRGAICALVLANIHTYDLVTISAAGIGFVVLTFITGRRDWGWLGRLVVIALGALPSIAWFLYVYRLDPVFQARAATLTFSEAPWKYLLGFGLLLLFALLGGLFARRHLTDDGRALLPAWAVTGFLMPYIPALFQRKLWMGVQWPLAMLSAAFLWQAIQRLSGIWRLLVICLTLVVLSRTNFDWVERDIHFLMRNESNTGLHTPFLSPDEWDVVRWLKHNTSPDDAVATMPNLACYVAAFAGNRTYVGHWSETPDFAARLREVEIGLLSTGTSEAEKRAILERTQAKYVVNDIRPVETSVGAPVLGADLSAFGPVVHRNGSFTIYQISGM